LEEETVTDSVNTRELILGILMEVTKEGSYSHLVIRSVLDKYQYLEKKERAFITRVSEGTIQYMIELDYIINQFSKVKVKKMKPVIRNILRMGVYQIQYMDSVPDSAACNEAVKLARKSGFSTLSGFVNGVLRNIARNSGSIRYPDEEKEPVLALSVRYSMPEWIVEEWLNAYGMEQTKAILDAFSKEAPITIRTNVTKITPDALKEQLKAEGVTVQTLEELSYAGLPYTDAYHYAFAISGFDHLMALPSFQDGLFYVQDISSMMVAEAAAPEKGAHVIDVCAAPGGKSIHLAEMLDGTGSVESRDLTGYKTGLIEENISRHQKVLADLQSDIRLAERRVKGLTTMVDNLEKSKAEKEALLSAAEQDLKANKGDAEQLAAQVKSLEKELAGINRQLADKQEKLQTADRQLAELKENMDAIEERTGELKEEAYKYSHDIHSKVDTLLKDVLLENVVGEYRNVSAQMDVAERQLFDGSLVQSIAEQGTDVMHCATMLFLGMVDDATTFAETRGGGGGGSDLKWGRDEDEDNRAWALRCMRMASRMMRPAIGKKPKR
jgi:16S rRNA (cytosine967-C5)-methyltransferase